VEIAEAIFSGYTALGHRDRCLVAHGKSEPDSWLPLPRHRRVCRSRELLSAGGTVHLLAELGVVFLLFDIGLHFSTAHIRREARDIFGFGPLQVSASTILIAGCA
jgi:hypothetical protein